MSTTTTREDRLNRRAVARFGKLHKAERADLRKMISTAGKPSWQIEEDHYRAVKAVNGTANKAAIRRIIKNKLAA